MNNKQTTHNPDTDIKNMTFEQLVSEWEKTNESHTNSRRASDRYKLKPAQIANHDANCERTQIKMWAIENEIVSEYSHLIDGLKTDHHELWGCIVMSSKYKSRDE